MDTLAFFDVIGNMLATGPFTPADIILGLGAWAAIGGLVLAIGSALTPVPSAKKVRMGSPRRRGSEKKAAA